MVKLKDRGDISSTHIRSHSIFDKMPTEKLKPLFSFQYLDNEYCISRCDKDDKAALADQLRILGSQTWAELKQNGRHKTGYEKISRNALKTSIPKKLKEDVNFIAFRFSGKKPMVGFRENEVFHIIWLDRNFNLYDHT